MKINAPLILSLVLSAIINQVVFIIHLQRLRGYAVYPSCNYRLRSFKSFNSDFNVNDDNNDNNNNNESMNANNISLNKEKIAVDGAVCFFGKLISLPATAKSIKQYLLNQKLNKLHHYIHSPDLIDKSKLHFIVSDYFSTSLIKSAMNISFFEPSIDEAFDKISFDFYVKSLGVSRVGPMYPNQLYQMWGMLRCGEMIKHYEKQNHHRYKWIIFSRPDLMWIDDHIELKQLDDRFAWIPHAESDSGGFYDRHFVLNRDHAEIIFDRWNRLNKRALPPQLTSLPRVGDLENYFTATEILRSIQTSPMPLQEQLNMEAFGKYYYAYNNITVKRFRASCFLTCLTLEDESKYSRNLHSTCKDRNELIPYIHKYKGETLEAIAAKRHRRIYCDILQPYHLYLFALLTLLLYLPLSWAYSKYPDCVRLIRNRFRKAE